MRRFFELAAVAGFAVGSYWVAVVVIAVSAHAAGWL